MVRITIIRQRPSIGDCLLLSPLIEQLKRKYPDSLITVITDDSYMCGSLPLTFDGIPGVDKVECINSLDWTTIPNQQIDPALHGASTSPLPHTVKTSDLVLDCNADFILFEREHKGLPPYGIAEFWLKHHNLFDPAVSLLPKYTISEQKKNEVDLWLHENNPRKKPIVGIVMRAGHPLRNWDYNDISTKVADWLHTKGYLPIGIDPVKPLQSSYGVSCINKRIDVVAALLARCKIVLTPDTGLLHLAQAVGTPQVALWWALPPELRVKGYDCTVVKHITLSTVIEALAC